MQAIIPHIPQLVQSVAPQHPTHPTVQLDLLASWEEPSALQPIKGLRFPHKVRSGTPGAIIGHSMSNTRVPTPNVPELDTLSSDSVDSLKALLRHCQLKPITASLLRLKQKDDEPLAQFVAYFTVKIQGIWEKGLLRNPNPMKTHREVRDKTRYYCFYCDYGHNTEECHDLRDQIEDLIHQGHLYYYVRKPHESSEGRYTRDTSPHSKGLIEKQIDVIVGKPAFGGDISSSQKAYSRAIVERRPRCECDSDIIFRLGEEEYLDHDDALVISV
ncbi:hypothetical protein B296_00003160 [Ensete ventricosum]|uniref:Retrotransposon gag domain-containing protein n=1 Tax=Ensete ventricosum TaxID=4639 RepID=A0A427AWP7_ENSVE|nr:hypothetical protein B296_00003160 [Ensete ventricosum]